MRTYWNVSLDRSNGKRFERLVHYICVPIISIHHAEDTISMTRKEVGHLAETIANHIILDINGTYRTFSVNDIVHCSLEKVITLEGDVTNEFIDRLQILVNKEVQGSQSTQQSLSSVFESTLEKYNSPDDFADYLEETEEEVDYEDYSLDDTIDAISYALKTQEPVQAEWCLLMVDVYTGTLTEVTVETDKDKTLDSILGKYLENGFECVSKKRLGEVLRSA
ncbi:gp53 [Bacillus phage SPO1]|uniref:Putative gene 53 protein n=2 Tax=Bacillus phage SP01 TaxID=2884427 RepID=GP53_BPSP1|nr:kinase [Bacillus phage SPO1]O48407.1 RecName: Full=Putative gene 53 protein [Bacillus phage SPO1]AAC29022.1 unknown [Bacillus phage SPO1]ACI90928.1 gp53 [Bacillus phage SPO1]